MIENTNTSLVSSKGKDPLDESAGKRPGASLKRSRRSSKSRMLMIPWALSAFLALTLFTTFTYMPPDLPDKHPHILHNDVKQLIPRASTAAGGGAASSPAIIDQQYEQHDASKKTGDDASPQNDKTNPQNNESTETNNAQQQRQVKEEAPNSIAEDQLDLASLRLPADAKSVLLNEVPPNHPMNQNPIMSVLKEAAVGEISLEDWKKLPGLTQSLKELYGPRVVANNNDDDNAAGPIVLGMETCQAYRDMVPFEKRYVGAAGMFNTGTNALEHHLRVNVLHVDNVWQVPWGKHRMPYQRLKHTATMMQKRNQTECLPVVIVRDPYNWMQSMCKSPYAAHWKHGQNRCPNLAVNDHDRKSFEGWGNGMPNATSFRVKVIFDKDDVKFFDSLVDLWSEWYDYYHKATYPHLIIRFEDMLLQAPAVVAKIAECVGAQPKHPIEYQTGSAKAHGSHTDFLKAILKSADSEKRRKNLQPRDLEYAKAKLNPELLEAFEYNLLER